jgi:hypothetical protein
MVCDAGLQRHWILALQLAHFVELLSAPPCPVVCDAGLQRRRILALQREKRRG